MLVVLVDDVRWFRDGRPCTIARSSAEGLVLLRSLAGQRIDELWLDHDLGGDDTVGPVVDLLCAEPFDIWAIKVHSYNPRGAVEVRQRLAAAGYAVEHHFDVRIWSHSRPKVSDPGGTVEGRGGRS